MSSNYADSLSKYDNKGVLGIDEIYDDETTVNSKVSELADLIRQSSYVVVHTGAGISTSCGIPDFRSKTGVWTLEKQGLKPKVDVTFKSAIPSRTHLAIKQLTEKGYIKYVVSQNIDGLHMRSGIQRKYISELHGNMFIEECDKCRKQFIRSDAATTVGKKVMKSECSNKTRNCRGQLRDTILDWEFNLPEHELHLAEMHSTLADLNICLGSSMQIMPSGNLPLKNKKYGGKLVVCNLQPTKLDKKADIVIHTYVDRVFELLLQNLEDCDIESYNISDDPTASEVDDRMEWTIQPQNIKNVQKLYNTRVSRKRKKE